MRRCEGGAVFIFRALGPVTALLAVTLSIFGRDVRYLRLSPTIAKDNIAAALRAVGVKALSYEDVYDGLGKYCRLLSTWSPILFRDHVRDAAIESAIADELCLNATARERFSLSCEHYLQSELEEPVELLLFCQELQAQRPGIRITVIGPLDVPIRLLFSSANRGGNWRLLGLPRLPLLDYVGRLAVRYMRLIGRTNLRKGGDSRLPPPETQSRMDQRVIYFPHQGLLFGNLFAKDHYYSADPRHELHPSNMLHVSLGDADETLAQSHAYYRQHGIPHTDLMHLAQASLRKWLMRYLKLLSVAHRNVPLISDARPFRVYAATFYFARYSHLQLLLTGLSKLTKARLALVGYDILFPPMLSTALAARSIAVAATQERFFAVFYDIFHLAFDYYFPLGERACRHIRERPNTFAINHCLPVGPVRSELILRAQAEIPEKYLRIKKGQVLVLALDWHSAPNAVENARVKTNTWRVNKRYYRDMMRLAVEFPKIHIVVKGRDNSSLIPEMRNECEAIEAMPNMSIERDHVAYPPSLMAAAADLTIACHTSLVDELLAVGRPAMSYDFCGFPDGLFDYDGYSIIVRTYDELRQRVSRFLTEGQVMDSEQFSQIRRDFYNWIPGEPNPRQKLLHHLEEILEHTLST